MPRGIFNWTFNDVIDFLKRNGFIHSHVKGSHYYYIGHYHGEPRIVQVPFHGSKAFKPRTLKGIVIQSGLSLDLWLKE
jgi:predicted RNA binding protein YcfA (HicA-like mRNA interferase family)